MAATARPAEFLSSRLVVRWPVARVRASSVMHIIPLNCHPERKGARLLRAGVEEIAVRLRWRLAFRQRPLFPTKHRASVGLCFSALPPALLLRRLSARRRRRANLSRAAAFTAEATRNGFGLRGFEGMS